MASRCCFLVFAATCGFVTAGAQAALVDGPAFTSLAVPSQMFQPAQDGTVNPVETLTGVPGYGTITVSYGPYFMGQTASSFFSPPTSVSGSLSDPLALDLSPGPTFDTSYATVVEVDANVTAPDQEVLGGVPAIATNGFGGPVAILFSQPVTGVELTAGYFDGTQSTTIQAFTTLGVSLGTVTNQSTGFEVFNLDDSTGAEISGLLISTTDPGGFGIDGVGIAAAPPVTAVPAPGAAALLPGLFALLAVRRRTKLLPAG